MLIKLLAVHKRRSFALGVFAVGSSVGGIVHPIVVQQLLERMSFQWTMRIVASILGAAILISNLVCFVSLSRLVFA